MLEGIHIENVSSASLEPDKETEQLSQKCFLNANYANLGQRTPGGGLKMYFILRESKVYHCNYISVHFCKYLVTVG